MQARIADEASATGLTSQIKDEIQSAIKFYQTTRFAFNQGLMTITTDSGRAEYTASDNADIPYIKQIFTCAVGGNGWSCPMNNMTYEELLPIIQEAGGGNPVVYSYYDRKLYIGPLPGSGYIIKIAYLKLLSDLSADADTNAWVDDAEFLIRSRAKRMLFENVLQQYEDANRAAVAEMEALNVLRSEEMQLSRDAPARFWDLSSLSRRGSFNIYRGY